MLQVRWHYLNTLVHTNHLLNFLYHYSLSLFSLDSVDVYCLV